MRTNLRDWKRGLPARWSRIGAPHGGGFTLIELLVVIVMIGLGALMLIPTLARTSPSVKSWQCINNLEHWSQAMRLYTTDNLDAIPRDGMDQNSTYPGINGGHADKNAWFNLLPQFVGERTLNDYWNDAGSPMARLPFPGGKGKPWHCPSASMTSADVAMLAGGGVEGFFSYDMNIDLKRVTPGYAISDAAPYPGMPKLATYQKPSATVEFFDCAFNPRTEIVNASPQYNSVNPANRWKSFAARHFSGGVISFLDGHAKYYKANYVLTNASTEIFHADIIWNAPYRAANP